MNITGVSNHTSSLYGVQGLAQEQSQVKSRTDDGDDNGPNQVQSRQSDGANGKTLMQAMQGLDLRASQKANPAQEAVDVKKRQENDQPAEPASQIYGRNAKPLNSAAKGQFVDVLA